MKLTIGKRLPISKIPLGKENIIYKTRAFIYWLFHKKERKTLRLYNEIMFKLHKYGGY